jgi:folate-binding protein YgfZ
MAGPDGVVVGVCSERAASLTQEFESAGFACGSSDEFVTARIACNWPWFGSEISEQNLPQEIDRDSLAISFTKGCYLGQETIARLDALGQIQKKLSRLEIDTVEPLSGAKVESLDGKEVGWVTSDAMDGSGAKRIAFAFLRRGSFVSGTSLRVNGADCRVL